MNDAIPGGREMRIASGKIEIVPLVGLRGVLTGGPRILTVEGSQ